MIKNILKTIIIILFTVSAVIPFTLSAQSGNDQSSFSPFQLFTTGGNTYIRDKVNTWKLQVRSLGSTGSPCLTITSTGIFGTTTCGGFSSSSAVAVGPAGSIQFASTTTGFFDGVSSFFWDKTNSRLGIGTTTPAVPLHVIGSSTISSLNASNCDVFSTITGALYCGTNGSGGGGATTTINGVSGPTFTFATGTATGIGLTISTSTGTVTFTPTVGSGFSIPLTASTTQWATAYGSTTALTPAYIRGLFSGSSPITFNSGTGAIGFDFSTNNTWTGGNTFGNATSSRLFSTTTIAINSSSTNQTISGILYLPALANGCLEKTASGITSTGSNCGTGGGGITNLNGQTGSSQSFATTTSGTQFYISSSGDVHTFNFPASPIFTNASTTGGATIAGVLYLPGVSNGCMTISGGIATSTGSACGAGGGGSNWTVGSNFLRTSTTTDYVLASYYVASSTTGTSTFAGKVGIGTTTLPSGYTLNVNGKSRFNDSGAIANLAESGLGGYGGYFENSGGTLKATLASPLLGHYFENTSSGYSVQLGSGANAMSVAGPSSLNGNTTITGNTTNSGTLLIGTTTPTNKLFVQGAGGANPFVIASSTGSTMLSLSQAGVLNISALSDGCLQASSGDITSTGSACGSGGGGSNWTVISGGLRTSTTTDFARAAYFVATSTTATSTFAGGVGIGTTTPLAKFSVNANSANFVPVSIGSNSTFAANISDNLDAISGVQMGNTNTGTAADFRFLIKDTTGHYFAFMQPGVNNSGTSIFGQARSAADFILNSGGTTRNLVIGALDAKDVIFGTNNTERVRITSAGNVGIGSSTPLSKLIVSGSIIVPEVTVATSTAMLLDVASSSSNVSNNYLLRIGTSAMTINFATSSLVAGAKTDVTVCNPAGGTAGTITWDSRVSWPGGFAPGQTTTANNCDIWTFKVTNGTSSLRLFGNVSSGY